MPCPEGMVLTIDSKPAFAQKLAEMGLNDLVPKFTELCWLTFGDFGFACHEGPGCTQEVFQKTVLTPLLVILPLWLLAFAACSPRAM